MKPALVIGHTPDSPGAVNVACGKTEFDFNNVVAKLVAGRVGIEIVYRDRPNQYGALPAKINALSPPFIISLHANAFNRQASGTEVLYWHQSPRGRDLAEILQANLFRALGLPDRGAKPIRGDDRGGYLLKNTKAPCVIAEPFFIDNDSDLKKAEVNLQELVDAYAKTIEVFR